MASPPVTKQINIATATITSPQGIEEMKAFRPLATRNGETVQPNRNPADSSSMNEELGMAGPHFSRTSVDKLKIKKGAGATADALKRIAEYIDKAQGPPEEQRYLDMVQKFRTFEQSYRSEDGTKGQPTPDDILKFLAGFDGDVTEQFFALENLLKQAGTMGLSADTRAALEATRSGFLDEGRARDIISGAAASQAMRIGERFGASPADFRESYRALLREPTPSLAKSFEALRGFSLTRDFKEVVQSFMNIAAGELDMLGPLADSDRLNAVMVELTKLKNIQTVLDAAGATVRNLNRPNPPGASSQRPDATELTSRILAFAALAKPTPGDADRLVRGYEGEVPKIAVMAVNGIIQMHNALPDSLFASPSAREAQKQSLLALSQRLVQAEEQAFGS